MSSPGTEQRSTVRALHVGDRPDPDGPPPTQPLEAPGENIARSIVVVHHGLRLLSTRCVVQGVLAHLEVQLPPRQGVAQDDHVSMTPPWL